MTKVDETIGVDVGGTKMLLGVVDAATEVHYESRAATGPVPADALMDMFEGELHKAVEARPGVAAIGIGLPCRIDHIRGVAIGAVNLDLEDVAIQESIASELGLPVFIENDATVAAIAEWRYGAARGWANVVMVTVGTGIGGGLILDGKVFRGRNGAGGELGHTVIQADGPPCQGSCPGRGCVEALASGTAMGREGRLAAELAPGSALGLLAQAGEEIDAEAVIRVAHEGDGVAREVVDLIGERLGIALTTFANIFEPDVIVVGGGVLAAGEMLLGPARDQVIRYALPPMDATPVVAAELGNRAGMFGAAHLARMGLEDELRCRES